MFHRDVLLPLYYTIQISNQLSFLYVQNYNVQKAFKLKRKWNVKYNMWMDGWYAEVQVDNEQRKHYGQAGIIVKVRAERGGTGLYKGRKSQSVKKTRVWLRVGNIIVVEW